MEVHTRATHEGRVTPEFAESLDSAWLDQIACSRDALMYQMY